MQKGKTQNKQDRCLTKDSIFFNIGVNFTWQQSVQADRGPFSPRWSSRIGFGLLLASSVSRRRIMYNPCLGTFFAFCIRSTKCLDFKQLTQTCKVWWPLIGWSFLVRFEVRNVTSWPWMKVSVRLLVYFCILGRNNHVSTENNTSRNINLNVQNNGTFIIFIFYLIKIATS